MKRLHVAMLVIASVVLATAATALAGGGNSAAAHACQQGGWQSLYRADGVTTFANQGDCVSYAAQGGTFGTPPSDQGSGAGLI